MHGMSAAMEPQASAPIEPVSANLDGHLTREGLEAVLAELSQALPEDTLTPVLLDCTRMGGYDLDARHAFVTWNKQSRDQISRVAIVTSNRLYHVVIATMSLASGQAMKGFHDHDDALAWLQI